MGGSRSSPPDEAHVPSGVADGPCKKKKPMWFDPLVVGQVHKRSALTIWSSRKVTVKKRRKWTGPLMGKPGPPDPVRDGPCKKKKKVPSYPVIFFVAKNRHFSFLIF